MRTEVVTLSRGRQVSARVVGPAANAPAVVLAPGAGSDLDNPLLRALQDALGAAGWTAVTFNFPYREAGRRVPDPPAVLQGCWRAVLDWVRARCAPPWLAAGGRSMGGRIASQVAAGGATIDALVFLGFPLHPAGRADTARAAHLPAIHVPMLFVQGTRDALAEPALLASVLATLPTATQHTLLDADHAFRVPRRSGRAPAEVQAEIVTTVVAWLAAVRQAAPSAVR